MFETTEQNKVFLHIINKSDQEVIVPFPEPIPDGVKLFNGNDTKEFIDRITGGNPGRPWSIARIASTKTENSVAKVTLEDGTEYWCVATRLPVQAK